MTRTTLAPWTWQEAFGFAQGTEIHDARTVVYVACDPVAFARDAGTLAGLGYALGPLRAFDLFPNTHHVEAVGRFTRE